MQGFLHCANLTKTLGSVGGTSAKRFAESVIERTVAMEAPKIRHDACSTNGMKQMTRN